MDDYRTAWPRLTGMMKQGLRLDEIERVLEQERRDEWAAMESEHRRRMWLDVYTPFLVGMASIAWCVGVIYFGGSEWVACLALPGVAWCQYKLATFMWGGNHSS